MKDYSIISRRMNEKNNDKTENRLKSLKLDSAYQTSDNYYS